MLLTSGTGIVVNAIATGRTNRSARFDRAVYGTLSIAADLMKIALPLAVMILWRKGERIFAIAAAVFWTGAVAFSLSAAIGFAASTRGHAVAAQSNLIESRNAWKAKIIVSKNVLISSERRAPQRLLRRKLPAF